MESKDENIGFDGYIGTWILRIYIGYIGYIGDIPDISDISEIYRWIFLHEYRYIEN